METTKVDKAKSTEQQRGETFKDVVSYARRNNIRFPVRFAEPPFQGQPELNQHLLKHVNDRLLTEIQKKMMESDNDFHHGRYSEIE